MAQKAGKNEKKLTKQLSIDKERLEAQLGKVQTKLNKLLDAIEEGGVGTFKTLKERMQTLEEEKDGLEKKLDEIGREYEKVQQQTLDVGAMQQAFSSLRDILKKAEKGDPYLLKGLLFRIIEVVEWTEDPEDKSQGHCCISYFETPHLTFPIRNSEQLNKELFAECHNWGG